MLHVKTVEPRTYSALTNARRCAGHQKHSLKKQTWEGIKFETKKKFLIIYNNFDYLHAFR